MNIYSIALLFLHSLFGLPPTPRSAQKLYRSSAEMPYLKTVNRRLTLSGLVVTNRHSVLDTFGHPLCSSVRLELSGTPTSRFKLSLMGPVNLLLLVFVNDTIIIE